MNEPDHAASELQALARSAIEHWDLEVAELSLYMHRENAVFRVVDPSGEVFALRIHREGYHDLEALQSEHRFTTELARAGFSVPEAIPTAAGEAYASVAFADGSGVRQVGLVRWIAGATLAKLLETVKDPAEKARLFRQLGRVIAGFHDCAARWKPPSEFRRHAWDAEGLAGDAPMWGRFWEIANATDLERSRLSAIRDALRLRLSRLNRGPEAYGVIHADINADNVLVDDETLSVIDFDDAGFGWYVFDLAVAVYDRLDAFRGDDPDFDLVRDALFGGYEAVRPLTHEQRELFPLFLLIRTLMLLSWTEDRPETGLLPLIPVLLALGFQQAEALGLVD